MRCTKGISIFVLLFLAAACDRGSSSDDAPGSGGDASLKVVATIGMLADMASELGGDCVEVEGLMGPGVDPHLYRASAGDLETLSSAQQILYGGMLLEGAMGDVLERMAQRTPTLAALETVDEENLLSLPDSAGHFDPHLWMDVGLWAQILPPVEEALTAQRSDCAEAIAARGAAYSGQLVALDSWVRESVATIPEGQRALVTAHDAFAYYGRAYGLEVRGIQGVSTESEASVADIRETADFIVGRRIPAIFVESSVNARNIEAVQAAVASRGWTVALGEPLFSDAMGDEGTWQGTYIGMIRSNTLSVLNALGGTAAPWPDALAEWAGAWSLP